MKVRVTEVWPDELLASAEVGLYWHICCLIYSGEAPVARNDARISFPGTSKKSIATSLAYLIDGGYLIEQTGWLDIPENHRFVTKVVRRRDPSNPRPSADDWARLRREVFERDGFTCQYCGQRGGALECDHIEPVSNGGLSHLGNLATACRPCNRAKGARSLAEWRRA